MISKLKKFVGNEQEGGVVIPDGVKVMGAHLQRKFARGVQYNMKVIIKGERNTGKSTLLYRLQGYKFVPEYTATDEIQVAVIHWSASAATNSQEVVKVDIWDIVDKGKSKKKNAGLKITNDQPEEDVPEPCLDADFLDVYQGTHAVIFIFDITKQWTYDYVIKNLPLVPHEIPVLVMANFMDNQENRVIGENTGMKQLHDAAKRPLVAAPVVIIESSLKDGFGLKMVHKFLNLPFLSLQRKSLLQMVETNKENTIKLNESFQNLSGSKDCNYANFLEKLEERKQKSASTSSPEKNVSPSHGASDLPNGSANTSPSRAPPEASSSQGQGPPKAENTGGFGSKLTRMFSSKKKKADSTNQNNAPKGDTLDDFLDGGENEDRGGRERAGSDEDSDEFNQSANPMVENFYIDVESGEEPLDVETSRPTKLSTSSKTRKISSSSDEEPEIAPPAITDDDPFVDFIPEETPGGLDALDELDIQTNIEPPKVSGQLKKQRSEKSNSSPAKNKVEKKVSLDKKTIKKKKKKRKPSDSDEDSDESDKSSTTTSEGGEPVLGSDELGSDLDSDDQHFHSFINSQKPAKAKKPVIAQDSLIEISDSESKPHESRPSLADEILSPLSEPTVASGGPSSLGRDADLDVFFGSSVAPSTDDQMHKTLANQDSSDANVISPNSGGDGLNLFFNPNQLDFLETVAESQPGEEEGEKKTSRKDGKKKKPKKNKTEVDSNLLEFEGVENDNPVEEEKPRKKKKKKKTGEKSEKKREKTKPKNDDSESGENELVQKVDDYESL